MGKPVQIAARFPIKSCPELFFLGVCLHGVVAISAIMFLTSWWLIGLIILSLLLSLVISFRQYEAITSFNSDLCWTGENWVVSDPSSDNSVTYLELASTCWLTADFSLLKFVEDHNEHAWFFTKKHLGERAFRELGYLVKQDLKAKAKIEQN